MAQDHLSSDELMRRRKKRASLEEERVRMSERRVKDERERVAFQAAKTARLRGLRKARDEAEGEAEAVAGRTKPTSRR
jgi:hypothetical protein